MGTSCALRPPPRAVPGPWFERRNSQPSADMPARSADIHRWPGSPRDTRTPQRSYRSTPLKDVSPGSIGRSNQDLSAAPQWWWHCRRWRSRRCGSTTSSRPAPFATIKNACRSGSLEAVSRIRAISPGGGATSTCGRSKSLSLPPRSPACEIDSASCPFHRHVRDRRVPPRHLNHDCAPTLHGQTSRDFSCGWDGGTGWVLQYDSRPTAKTERGTCCLHGADDRLRTGDLNLGKTRTTVQPVRFRVIPCSSVGQIRSRPCSRWDAGWDEERQREGLTADRQPHPVQPLS
jgi:hypothetical protein